MWAKKRNGNYSKTHVLAHVISTVSQATIYNAVLQLELQL